MSDFDLVISCESEEEREEVKHILRTRQWIPCTERLPEEEEMGDIGVIATVEGREGHVVYKHGVVPDAWFEEGAWYVNGVRLRTAKVIAWMPLPEAYTEVEHDS